MNWISLLHVSGIHLNSEIRGWQCCYILGSFSFVFLASSNSNKTKKQIKLIETKLRSPKVQQTRESSYLFHVQM